MIATLLCALLVQGDRSDLFRIQSIHDATSEERAWSVVSIAYTPSGRRLAMSSVPLTYHEGPVPQGIAAKDSDFDVYEVPGSPGPRSGVALDPITCTKQFRKRAYEVVFFTENTCCLIVETSAVRRFVEVRNIDSGNVVATILPPEGFDFDVALSAVRGLVAWGCKSGSRACPFIARERTKMQFQDGHRLRSRSRVLCRRKAARGANLAHERSTRDICGGEG